jgi:putative ABC transport system permease protein
VMALSVAQRVPSLALLGVLGLAPRSRAAMVRAECLLLGGVGSVLGIGAGTVMAQVALAWLAGDLGGGYFPGVTPALQWSGGAAIAYGALGVAAAVAGGWLPARAAQRMAPALVLKGLAPAGRTAAPARLAVICLLGAAGLALAPPVAGLPIAAYFSVACLLVGGIASIPLVVRLLLARLPRPNGVVSLLAIERARHQHRNATIAIAGVVASLALSVALTVMVGSFRGSVASWLDQVLPAELYLRSASTSASADSVYLPDGLLEAVRTLPGVERAIGQRVVPVQLDPALPAVPLLARPLGDAATSLPLVGRLLPAAPGMLNVFVSEAVVSLYGATPGSTLTLPLPRQGMPGAAPQRAHVRGLWRDYACKHGAIALDAAEYQAATGDVRLNDLALWLRPGATATQVRADVKRLAGDTGLLEFASSAEVRATSLRIFDRSFAVTYWLQAVAIGIGLVGMATSFSAQVLARRREFGALVHLGLTRAQIGRLVALEGALWSGAGALLGSLLGLAVSVVLVKVVNPQSFHWTMELAVPWGRVALLVLGVVAGAALTSWLAARLALRANLAGLVKQDW